jgi:hypothetical protein
MYIQNTRQLESFLDKLARSYQEEVQKSQQLLRHIWDLRYADDTDGILRESDWFNRAMEIKFPPLTMDRTIEDRRYWLWNLETHLFLSRDFLCIESISCV